MTLVLNPLVISYKKYIHWKLFIQYTYNIHIQYTYNIHTVYILNINTVYIKYTYNIHIQHTFCRNGKKIKDWFGKILEGRNEERGDDLDVM